MTIYSVTNVPCKNSDIEIRGHVEGENVYIIAAEKGSQWRDGRSVGMASDFLGPHLMEKPELMRRMYADSVANAFRLGRDAGYAHAQADIRAALGIKK